MIKLKDLHHVVLYLNKQHRPLFKRGINCYTTIKNADGNKDIVSITKRIYNLTYEIHNSNSMVLCYFLAANSLDHNVYISNLKMINIYESFVEFMSTSRLDFMYTLRGGPTFELFNTVRMNVQPPHPIAQWIHNESELESAIDNLGKQVVLVKEDKYSELDFD